MSMTHSTNQRGAILIVPATPGDANIALGMILEMHIPGQICILNASNSDGYSTGNAPQSGNKGQ